MFLTIPSNSSFVNVKTENKAPGYKKYDHFFTKKWYGYAEAAAEQDEVKDLDLRYTLGVGAGYQFVESERTNFSLEGGVSYVDGNYIVAEDNSFTAGRWGLRFDHFLHRLSVGEIGLIERTV